MAGSKKKFYAVARGRATGIFSSWFGTGNAEEQVRGFAGARYKGFTTIEEARVWLKEQESNAPAKSTPTRKKTASPKPKQVAEPHTHEEDVVIYTDGGCSFNPGPGGYGAIIIKDEKTKEISGGYKHTTNNRMELMACIMALKDIEPGLSAVVHSDSQYVVNGIAKGWAEKWRAKGWMRNKNDAAENYDLWKQLLEACEKINVRFVWVKGHAGHEQNERCDELATGAAAGTNLPPDKNFEEGCTTINA